jgi:glycosyltransferase involved in cell wall biosynthesis
MIRIAYIVDSFSMGGLERCVARLVNGLDRERFDSFVICFGKSGAAQHWIERPDVPIIELHKRAGNDPRLVKRLADVLRGERIDVAHSHNWGTLIETSLARKWAKTPVHVHSQRGMFYHGRDWLKRKLRRAATRWAANRADCVLAVADSVREYWLKEFGVSRTPIEVIANGVDVPRHDPTGTAAMRLRESMKIHASDFVIGSVGRLVSVKSFVTLIDAIARLSRTDPRLHLVLVGGGPEHERLTKHACAAQISERVHLVGEQNNVGDWLKTMQLYVNCSLSEGMSQSILEAMAMGLPMVVADVGENRRLTGSILAAAPTTSSTGSLSPRRRFFRRPHDRGIRPIVYKPIEPLRSGRDC